MSCALPEPGAALLVGERKHFPKTPHVNSHDCILCSRWPALGGGGGSCRPPILQLEKLRPTAPAERASGSKAGTFPAGSAGSHLPRTSQRRLGPKPALTPQAQPLKLPEAVGPRLQDGVLPLSPGVASRTE